MNKYTKISEVKLHYKNNEESTNKLMQRLIDHLPNTRKKEGGNYFESPKN